MTIPLPRLFRPATLVSVILVWICACAMVCYTLLSRDQVRYHAIAQTQTHLLFDAINEVRLLTSGFEGVFVEQTPDVQANPILPKPLQTLQTDDGRTFVRIAPANLVRLLSPKLAQHDVGLSLPSLTARHPQSLPDNWEKEQLERMQNGPQEEVFSLVTETDGSTRFRFMKLLPAQASCLKCHPEKKLGDPLGALSLSLPPQSLEQAVADRHYNDIAVMTLVALFGLLFIFLAWRQGRKRLIALRDNEYQLRTMIELSGLAGFDYVVASDRASLSPRWNTLFGVDYTDPIELNLAELMLRFAGCDQPVLKTLFDRLLMGVETRSSLEVRLKTQHNNLIWCQLQIVSITDSNGSVIRLIGQLNNIDVQKREKNHLITQASLDSLTGLYNKGTIEKLIETQLIDHVQSGYTLLIVDLDDFKTINDTHGHLQGDAALKALASSLRAASREGALCGRFGGDEFLLFIANALSDSQIGALCTEIINRCRAYRTEQGGDLHLSCSIGATSGQCQTATLTHVMNKADTALYRCKFSGKGSYNIER